MEAHELDFYQSMPEPLKEYTAEFRGIIPHVPLISRADGCVVPLGVASVEYCEDESGYIQLLARPLNPTMEKEELSLNNDDGATTCTDHQLTDTNVKKLVQFVDDLHLLWHSTNWHPIFRLRCSEDGCIDYSNGLGMDIRNYEQGKVTMSVINPWALQLCRKHAEKLHRQLIGDENACVSHSEST